MIKKFKVTVNLQAQVTYEIETDTLAEATAIARDRLKNEDPRQDPSFFWTLNEDLDPIQIEGEDDEIIQPEIKA